MIKGFSSLSILKLFRSIEPVTPISRPRISRRAVRTLSIALFDWGAGGVVEFSVVALGAPCWDCW